ncbi:hypothetical protein [Aquidulcibacter sp.]|jgi:hypothetical protein|uniref:hypothetical protein n=1 Tax=Aquidulcibacter sp. TaxID=2052990 RepID=UPI0028AAEAA8|nr:hypothetical protein [Aquidulcibacter sp.]
MTNAFLEHVNVTVADADQTPLYWSTCLTGRSAGLDPRAVSVIGSMSGQQTNILPFIAHEWAKASTFLKGYRSSILPSLSKT